MMIQEDIIQASEETIVLGEDALDLNPANFSDDAPERADEPAGLGPVVQSAPGPTSARGTERGVQR